MHQLRETAAPESICGILARVFFAVEDADIKLDCRRAVYSAKRMSAKIKSSRVVKAQLKEQLKRIKQA